MPRSLARSYECEEPPCLHVVVDYPRKLFAVFLETSDGEIVYIPLERLEKAYREATELARRHFREARGEEIDRLARDFLEAEPIEDEEP